MEIYFDESGFTGDNLLHDEQPFYAYCSVALVPEKAEEIASRLIKDFRIQGDEIKGRNLIKYNRGRKAISFLINECQDNFKIVVHHKKYALSSKFFEYIFEPVLSKNNFLFYNAGFHKFIANLLFIEFQARSLLAEEIFNEFEDIMRRKNVRDLEYLFLPNSENADISPFLSQIFTFCFIHKDIILEEINSLKGKNGVGQWILDLTTTSLYSLLCHWGEQFESLDVYCDNSAPLEADHSFFDAMIGRTDKVYQTVGGQKSCMTFNLSKRLELVDSKQNSGVQIADAIAAGTIYAFKNRNECDAEKIRQQLLPSIHGNSIFPDIDNIDLKKREPVINALILHELIERSKQGRCLLTGMEEFIYTANSMYPTFSLDVK